MKYSDWESLWLENVHPATRRSTKIPEPEVEPRRQTAILEEVSSTAKKSTAEVKTFEDAEATEESPINPAT